MTFKHHDRTHTTTVLYRRGYKFILYVKIMEKERAIFFRRRRYARENLTGITALTIHQATHFLIAYNILLCLVTD